MRIACTNCGQVMEVADQMAGQVVSCARCRTNIQVPAAAAQPVAAPTQNVTVQVGAPMVNPGAASVRHYGRGVGITLGILLLLFLVLPQKIAPPAQGVQGSTINVTWPWEKAVKAAKPVQTQAWVRYLLPGFAALLVIIGACLPSPVRGLFIWLAGMVLLLTMQLWGIFAGGGAGGRQVLFWLLLAMTPSLFMIIGGHGAAMRRAGKIGSRLGAGLPTLVVLAAIATALVIQLPKQQVAMGQFIPGGTMPSSGVTQLANLLVALAWGFAGLVGISVLLGLVNLFAGNRGVGIGGYVCGILGFFAFAAMLIVPSVVWVATNAQMAVRVWPDLLCGGGALAHQLAPMIFGLILVLTGWGSMWKLDRPAGRQ